MEKQELDTREKCVDNIEGYFGHMDNLYMLTTDDLIKLHSIVEDMRQFELKALIATRKEINW